MKTKAIFPGSFDPFTKGHEDIVHQGLKLFDEVVIAIGENTSKKRHFVIHDEVLKIESYFQETPGVTVMLYDSLTVDLVRKLGSTVILRGLRNHLDFEYEKAIAYNNKVLAPEIDTVFLITKPELSFISSTIIREIAKNGEDVSRFIPGEG